MTAYNIFPLALGDDYFELAEYVGFFVPPLLEPETTDITIPVRVVARLWLFALTGAPDGLEDVDLPVSSIQMRRVSGRPSYVQVVVPNSLKWGDAVTNRPNGEMIVYRAWLKSDGSLEKHEVQRANQDTIRTDWGARSGKITLTGYKQTTYQNPTTINIGKVSYENISDGKTLIRTLPNHELNPLDTIQYGEGSSFQVDLISYWISASTQQMEVSE